jgi:peptide/nickel transport system permease protein
MLAFIAMCLALSAVIAIGRALASGDPSPATATDFSAKSLPPGVGHAFGTDWMGRDMLSRTLAGLSLSILVGLFAATASGLVALALGCVAALGGDKVDAAVTWLIDLVMGVPHIILLILISYAVGKGFWGVALGVALTHWPSLARVIRAEVMQCRQSTYVAQALRLGNSLPQVAWRHVVPHVWAQFLIGLILLFPHAILHEAALTFLGFGLAPEQPAIGIVLSESMAYLGAGAWWLAFFPGFALTAVVLLFSGCGANLRRLLDPQSSEE